MAKLNHILYFHAVRRRNGEVDYYWKPSRKLRALGYANLKLPDEFKAARDAAIAQNDAVAAALEQPDAQPAAPITAGTRTVRDAIADYSACKAFAALAPSSRANYRCYLRQIDSWASKGDGQSLLLAQLTRPKILELRAALNEDDRHHRRVLLLRVLGAFLQWCENQGWLAHPARNLRATGAPPRKQRLLRADLQLLVDAAAALAMPHIAAGVPLAFYTLQRRGDLLAATAFKLGELHDISEEARRALAGPDGRALGLFLEQEKTDTPVGVALIPETRAAIEAMFAEARAGGVVTGTHLIPNPGGAGACPQWRLERDFRAVVDHAVAALEASGDNPHALARLRSIQFRDLRRSGMCWMRDLGVPVPLIAANSGHSIGETQRILDIYMPRDTAGAAEGMAMALTQQAKRDARKARRLKEAQV